MQIWENINKCFVGDSVFLRGLEEEDLVLRPKWFNDPEINATLLMPFPVSYASTREWFRKSLSDMSRVNLSICDKDDGRVIGMTGLLQIDRINHHAQLYITIGEKEYWGKRLPDQIIPMVLAYAFGEQNLNKVYLWTIPSNSRGRHVYERNGFRKEAEMKEHYHCRGGLQDLIQHRMTKEEWVAFKVIREG